MNKINRLNDLDLNESIVNDIKLCLKHIEERKTNNIAVGDSFLVDATETLVLKLNESIKKQCSVLVIDNKGDVFEHTKMRFEDIKPILKIRSVRNKSKLIYEGLLVEDNVSSILTAKLISLSPIVYKLDLKQGER